MMRIVIEGDRANLIMVEEVCWRILISHSRWRRLVLFIISVVR